MNHHQNIGGAQYSMFCNENGTVIDKLLKSLVVTKFDWDELLIGDKNAIMIAARVLGYGKEYKFNWGKGEEIVDLIHIEVFQRTMMTSFHYHHPFFHIYHHPRSQREHVFRHQLCDL